MEYWLQRWKKSNYFFLLIHHSNIPAFQYSNFKFDVAARFALKVARYIMRQGLPRNTFLNINVPNLDEKEIKSYKMTQQGRLIHSGGGVIEKMDPRGRKYYWIGGGQLIFDKGRNTDMEAVSKSYISITPLNLDLTNYSSIRELKKWRI